MSEQYSIGRDESNDIVISHPYVSERHALLSIKDHNNKIFHIQDLDTTNGTYKNDQRVTETDFTAGDTIKLAGTVLEPALYLSLCSTGNASANASPAPSGKAHEPVSRTSSASKTSVAALSFVAAALVVAVGLVLALNQTVDVNSLVQIISLWAMMLITLYLSQSIMRGRNQLAAEKQYRRLVFDEWHGKIEADLKSRQEQDSLKANSWSGFRKFRIAKRVEEAEVIVSF